MAFVEKQRAAPALCLASPSRWARPSDLATRTLTTADELRRWYIHAMPNKVRSLQNHGLLAMACWVSSSGAMHLAWMARMSEFSRDAEETYAIGGPSLARRISQSSGSVFFFTR
jgi:hypothetical protein